MNVVFDKMVNEHSVVTAEEFVLAAREYLGVRYHPQARDKHGMDCGGLLLACGNDLDYTDLQVLGYSNSPDGESFERLLAESLTEISKEATDVGDVVACDFGKGIQHTAIVTALEYDQVKVIHATRRHNVCEQYLYGPYLKCWVKTYRLKHLV